MPILYGIEWLLGNGARGYANIIVCIEHLVILWLLTMPIRRDNSLVSVRARFFYYWALSTVYGVYAGWLKIGTYIPNGDTRFLIPHHEWAGVVAGMAWLAYGIAWWRGHAFVFSRALGGPGVEPMILMISGGESRVDVANEALEEGRIRL